MMYARGRGSCFLDDNERERERGGRRKMRRKSQDLQVLFIDLFIDLSDLFTFNWTLFPKDVSTPQ